ncbi:ribbon-helix-helix domain-containing protein [Nitrospirillum sp. BR 11828]|uniref:ribbon-helix-helix domain-containing protein n=1 Tax=Nitrospirillum sp. BR 11828 TaxID=3104325 RepID=UPI002ACACE8C|nr:type II toxin-antitoxin system ParD family antitoxin [Nitrospirillum sp. BR 11828]MDZ5646427.1 type II toxin-antitoxin system ParD family antitoxin [Nitrospirillum sp. BR 11828]
MPTRNVALTDHHERAIETLARYGCCQNASEVLRAGLRLVEQQEEEHAAKLKALSDAVDTGLRDLAEGRFALLESDANLEDYIANLGREAAGER